MDKAKKQTRVDGVVIGMITSISPSGEPMVAYSCNLSENPVAAKSTVAINADALGREVALLFESGDVRKPLIVGLIHDESKQQEIDASESNDSAHSDVYSNELIVDGERINLTAAREIVLKCGKASITMTRAGKVIIRGAYISTRSSGVNRIKGGSVQIN